MNVKFNKTPMIQPTHLTVNVSFDFLEEHELKNGESIAIPLNPKNLNDGVIWKSMYKLSGSDYDKMDKFHAFNRVKK